MSPALVAATGTSPANVATPAVFISTYLNAYLIASTAEGRLHISIPANSGRARDPRPPWSPCRTVPGSCFGLAPYFRLSYATSEQICARP